jgi:hypothetical protein
MAVRGVTKGELEKARKLRDEWTCPWSMRHCKMAKWCELNRQDSCKWMIGSVEFCCAKCKEKRGGCEYVCFREA